MKTAKNIFLIGPMGAGKTTIGRGLAKALKIEFLDSDREIEQRTGASIPLIFELEGEAGFRARESVAIDDLSRRTGIVLATGGGAILDPKNRNCLAARGFVIYLHAALETLLKRTARDHQRPLLQTDDPAARLAQLVKQRDPLYREIADLIVETGDRAAGSVVRDIVKQING